MALIGTARMVALARWKTLLGAQTIVVPPNKGALWTGIGAATAARLARQMQLVTLETTGPGQLLDSGRWKADLDADFGPDWCAEKREVFKALSLRYVSALQGLVTVFLPEGMERPRNGAEGSFAFAVKIIWDELRDADFGDPRMVMHRMTAMRVCRVSGGVVVRETFMSSSNQVH